MFPRIYALEENKECSVHVKLQGDVEFSLHRQVRGGVEAQQLVQLQDLIGRIVIQRQVEDLQLGVESYQKKLNLTKPDTFRSNLRNRTTYTAYSDPKRVIYKDQNNKNKLMRADELHKFSDGTLNDVRIALYDIAKGIRMEYLPKRKWSRLDKRRARVMVQDISKHLYERRLMRNLEKFVGGREYGKDLSQNQRDLPRDIPLDSVEVLRSWCSIEHQGSFLKGLDYRGFATRCRNIQGSWIFELSMLSTLGKESSKFVGFSVIKDRQRSPVSFWVLDGISSKNKEPGYQNKQRVWTKMTETKFDTEKFDGKNDFALWQVRMKALLEQQGLASSLKELHAATIATYNNFLQKKAYSALILCFGDRVLQEITKETTKARILKKFETLYMTKSLANRDLAAINTAISDEDQALLLFTSLPSYYNNFVETLLYGWDTLKLEDMLVTLNSRELQKMTEAKGDGGKGLYNHKKSQGFQKMTEAKGDGGKGFYVRGRSGQIDIVQGIIIRNLKVLSGMKLGGSYHITYKRDYLVDFEKYDGDNILLGDGSECRIRGTSKVQVHMRDGSSFVLNNVRYVPKLRRNLISLGTLEKEGFTVKMQSGKIKVIVRNTKVSVTSINIVR
ncbi:hypothetical protein Tco_0243355 [Tanacetum coccineum]